MPPKSLLDLPEDILVLLPLHLHTIEDYVNVSSTCNKLRRCMKVASPNTILLLAATQSRVFFRPSPHFLVAAVGRELGHWARRSNANEAILVSHAQQGVDGLLDLALQHCGLAMDRIRQLHAMRFATINPMTDLVDKCVGKQWYSTPDFWNGGVDDAYTIQAEPSETVFHLAIYGELFGPDLDTYLNPNKHLRPLGVETRLEFVKYCIPDWATFNCRGWDTQQDDGSVDRRRVTKKIGPYASDVREEQVWDNHNIALTWVLRSSRFTPKLKAMGELAGIADFEGGFSDGWWYVPDDHADDWRQRLLENTMVCQGLAGLEMLFDTSRARWVDRVRQWRDEIARLEKQPTAIRVGRQATHNYPYLIGDLRICVSGYVMGT